GKFGQILLNLLGNAAKFTAAGGVRLSVDADPCDVGRLRVVVADTGIGIPERDQSRLFQAFRQADASIYRRHGGTGLGLVIT
ncbi:histidine kinase, partial [Mycobacterium tuberculosis]|nr:histidine kinase [Mycobacterium tuberculosis]